MPMNPRLLRPTASGFNPKSIAGLEAWYAADVASSITIATGVQQWSDLSGKGRHLTQAVTNNQPAYNSVTLNGKPTVTFDGNNDSLLVTGFSVPLPAAWFAVFRWESAYTSGSPRVFEHGGVGTRAGEVWRQDTNDIRIDTFGATSGKSTRFRFRKNVVTADLAVEPRPDLPAGEIQQFNIYDFEIAGVNANPVSRVGMAMLQNSSYGNVSIAEYLLFGRWLSVSEADKVRQYLGKKYNLAFQA